MISFWKCDFYGLLFDDRCLVLLINNRCLVVSKGIFSDEFMQWLYHLMSPMMGLGPREFCWSDGFSWCSWCNGIHGGDAIVSNEMFLVFWCHLRWPLWEESLMEETSDPYVELTGQNQAAEHVPRILCSWLRPQQITSHRLSTRDSGVLSGHVTTGAAAATWAAIKGGGRRLTAIATLTSPLGGLQPWGLLLFRGPPHPGAMKVTLALLLLAGLLGCAAATEVICYWGSWSHYRPGKIDAAERQVSGCIRLGWKQASSWNDSGGYPAPVGSLLAQTPVAG